MHLESAPLDLALRDTWTIARNSSTRKTNVLVRLRDGRHEGLGEAAPNVRYGEDAASVLAAIDALRPILDAAGPEGDRGPSGVAGPGVPGAAAARHDALLDAMAAAAPGAHAARAAIDIALHDLAGRRAGMPVWRMLGADPGRMPVTSYSIGLDDPAAMQAKVKAAPGFALLKIKVGRGDDRATLAAIRAVTDRPLTVDANEAWTDPDRALSAIRWMADIGVVRVEQPLPAADRDGARFLHDRSPLPIFADEAAITEADLAALPGAYHGVNIKLQKAGGLRPARRMIATARALGLEVMLGCMIESSIGITAAAHLAPLADHADLDGHLLLDADPFRGAGLAGSRLVLPDGPGLGVAAR